MTVLYILGGLFLALVIIVPLIERSKTRISQQDVAKMARWVWPLVMILLILQLFMLVF